ncbi:unnamed protein product [Polarella glacialis]|uniref:Glutaredoxin 2 C-terminal domain-containing protein n=1 Tax=Polarella glacialis TaxID=89957 RepID=A0A813F6T2_POLGL|nr:unnamed protein product [Polarella glacialis]CAE8739575.1 unnamed protein product [Polarella glacialis]
MATSLLALRHGVRASMSRHRLAFAGVKMLSTSPALGELKLHMYDHCMFCSRARLVLGWLGVPYMPVTYGYGQGADPLKCAGTGYDPTGGPVKLTGKKSLPVLEGGAVPVQNGMKGMPESGEICSFVVALSRSDRKIAPATGRSDVAEWFARCRSVGSQLHRPRIIHMPLPDFADPRDVAYSKYSHTKSGFDYEASLAKSPQLLKEINDILQELEPMLRGETNERTPCLNAWGFSMDDVMILSYMRNLTCVRAIVWPTKVRDYVEKTCAQAGMSTYWQHAC